MSEHEQLQKQQQQQQHDERDEHDEHEHHEDDEVEPPFEVTVGVISMIQQDWWLDHPDVPSEAEAICAWEELHVGRRTSDVAPLGRSSAYDKSST